MASTKQLLPSKLLAFACVFAAAFTFAGCAQEPVEEEEVYHGYSTTNHLGRWFQAGPQPGSKATLELKGDGSFAYFRTMVGVKEPPTHRGQIRASSSTGGYQMHKTLSAGNGVDSSPILTVVYEEPYLIPVDWKTGEVVGRHFSRRPE